MALLPPAPPIPSWRDRHPITRRLTTNQRHAFMHRMFGSWARIGWGWAGLVVVAKPGVERPGEYWGRDRV